MSLKEKGKIVLAPDSFKESMTAKNAALAMKKGIHKVFPDAECIVVPMADGGDIKPLKAKTRLKRMLGVLHKADEGQN
ncbi:hypothetical protein BKP37_14135 [Anaerobacillus alkalilacustris]|uniref:Glycerate kinase n=1 Tax=Anaerobacillus alkalilacustris TaxID=393763 RepID=A0A1S2LJH2_9BACI|nr:hypothetical protein BKP37_14135 [Anaerobacillus alkalilacustris]